MSLMDVFRGFAGGTSQQQQNPTPPQNPNQPPNPNLVAPVQQTPAPSPGPGPQQVANPTVPTPGATATPASPIPGIPLPAEGAKSPLDNFANLWDAPKEPTAPVPLAPSMAIPPEKLQEFSKGIDFTKTISPEALANASKGDAAALAAVINAGGQAGFAHAIGATTKLIEAALERQAITFRDTVLPAALKAAQVTTAVRGDNDLFQHPAVAPVFSLLEKQVAAQYPTATPAQISDYTKNWFDQLTDAAVAQRGGTITMPVTPTPGSSAVRQETDFSKW